MAEGAHQLLSGGFAQLMGLELLESADGLVRARVAVREELKQPAGVVHGGVYAAMAEGMTSGATLLAVRSQGKAAMGLSNHTSFLRPVSAGHVTAVGRARHRGSTTWVWEVEFLDDEDRLCALSRVTVAVRPLPG